MRLGTVVMTREISESINEDERFAKFVSNSFKRFLSRDWGDLCEEDKRMNDSALKNDDDRIVARYNYDGRDIYIITEYDRSATTILFTNEY